MDSVEVTSSAFRRIARRISQRTTDLIAIAIVSIGVLTVSGRLTEWWNTDSSTALPPGMSANQLAGPSLRWGAGESAVRLLVGEQSVQMERRVLFGNQDRVDQILRDRLVGILEDSSSAKTEQPTGRDGHIAAAEDFHHREAQLMKLLKTMPPLESHAGNWNLYRLDRVDNPVPGSFLIATSLTGDSEKTESLAAWAVAMPSGPKQWTSFVMTPTVSGQTTGTATVPVPHSARLLLSLRADSTDELTVFQQLDARQADADRWIRDMTEQLTATGWHQARSWQQSADSSTARFERTKDGSRRPRQAVEISISFTEAGKLTGTANVIAIPEFELVPIER